jgi:hypothetical protein
MGLVTGVLALVAVEVLQPPPVPEHTQSLEFGSGLFALALLAAMTGWGISGGARWGRFMGSLVAIACAIAGLFGMYVLVVLLGYPGLWSRTNLAVTAVLLLMGITSVVLLTALVGAKHSAEDAIGLAPGRRAALMGFGLVIGIGASGAFSSWLSTLTEPPCCPL